MDTNVHKELSTLGLWRFDKILKNINLYFLFIKLILNCWPDIILIPISQSTLGFFKDSVFILISRLFFRRTLLQLRGSNLKNWLNRALVINRFYVSLVIRSTQGIIVLGNNLKYLFSDYFPNNKIFVVPNGADFNYQYSEKRNLIPKILYLSNFQASKGIEDVINAMAILKRVHKVNFHIDVVGAWRDSVTMHLCIQIAEDNNLPLTFHLPSLGKEKVNFFKNADIFVFPPRGPEGHPWVIVEAMAAGLPIISTHQGAITESVIDGVNGFIVEKKNPQQIAKKVKYLLEHPDIRAKMGLLSRQNYLRNFTEEKMVENLSICFNTIIKES